MRRAGLTVALAFAAFAAAQEDTPAVTNRNLEGEAADLAKALQNILIQTEGTEPATMKIGGEDNPLAFSISNQAGPEAVVLVIPEFKVAAKPGDAAGLGCYTIGDVKNKVALLMCEGVNTDITPPAKDGFEWVKGTIKNEGTEDICQVNFASANLKLADMKELRTIPDGLSKLTPNKLVPGQTMNYAFELPVDSIQEGIPAIGIKDSLGPCGLIEKAKEAWGLQVEENKKTAEAAKAAAAIATQANEAAASAFASATGGAKDTAGDAAAKAADAAAAATATVEKAAEEAAAAAKEVAEEAAAAAKEAVEEAAAAATKAAEDIPKVEDVIKLDGEGQDEATVKASEEVTSPAPKMSASVMGLFTVAVLVAVQLLL